MKNNYVQNYEPDEKLEQHVFFESSMYIYRVHVIEYDLVSNLNWIDFLFLLGQFRIHNQRYEF